jgi:hypothetical protein
MKYRLSTIIRWGRWQLKPWIKLSLATLETISNSHDNKGKQKLNAALAKINLIPILESFYEFLDDLPLWFY